MLRADEYGNIYEFEESTNSWIKKGIINALEIVTKDNDGLINPRIFKKLEVIKNSNLDKPRFKLWLEEIGDYKNYYYLRSGTRLITIKYEGNGVVRFEVNSEMLANQLIKLFKKRGPDGLQGKTGIDGRDGIIATPEEFFNGTLLDNLIYIDRYIHTPLETDISLRIYDLSEKQLSEIYINEEGITIMSDVGIINNLNLEFKDNYIKGFLDLTEINVKFKAFQIGKKGESGKDGVNYLEVIKTKIDNELMSNNAVTNIRKSNSKNNIYFTEDKIIKEIIAKQLSLSFLDIGEYNYFPSIQLSNNIGKVVGFYKPEFPNLDIPEYILPEWTPNDSCKNFTGVAHNDNYGGIILEDDFEPQSCSDVFKYNDGGVCAAIGEIEITPEPSDLSTNTQEKLPENGINFPTLYEEGYNDYDKDMSGSIDIYKQKVLFSKNTKIDISVGIIDSDDLPEIGIEIIINHSAFTNADKPDYMVYEKPMNESIRFTSTKTYYKGNKIKYREDEIEIIVKVNLNKIIHPHKYKIYIERSD